MAFYKTVKKSDKLRFEVIGENFQKLVFHITELKCLHFYCSYNRGGFT